MLPYRCDGEVTLRHHPRGVGGDTGRKHRPKLRLDDGVVSRHDQSDTSVAGHRWELIHRHRPGIACRPHTMTSSRPSNGGASDRPSSSVSQSARDPAQTFRQVLVFNGEGETDHGACARRRRCCPEQRPRPARSGGRERSRARSHVADRASQGHRKRRPGGPRSFRSARARRGRCRDGAGTRGGCFDRFLRAGDSAASAAACDGVGAHETIGSCSLVGDCGGMSPGKPASQGAIRSSRRTSRRRR